MLYRSFGVEVSNDIFSTDSAVVTIISTILHKIDVEDKLYTHTCYKPFVASVTCVLWLSGRIFQLGEGALEDSQLKSSILSQLLTSLRWASCAKSRTISNVTIINKLLPNEEFLSNEHSTGSNKSERFGCMGFRQLKLSFS